MMSIKYVCDLCGSETANDTRYTIPMPYVGSKTIQRDGNVRHQYYSALDVNLCPDCAQKLLDWWDSMKAQNRASLSAAAALASQNAASAKDCPAHITIINN